MHDIFVSLVPGIVMFLMVELWRIFFNLLAYHWRGHNAAVAWMMVS